MSIYGAALRELEQYRRDEAAGLLLRLPVPLGLRYGGYGTTQPVTTGSGSREIPLWPSSHPAPHRGAYPLYPGSAGRWGKTVFSTEAEGRTMLEHDTKREGESSP